MVSQMENETGKVDEAALTSKILLGTSELSSAGDPPRDCVEHTLELSHREKLESLCTSSLPHLLRVILGVTPWHFCSRCCFQTEKQEAVSIYKNCLQVPFGVNQRCMARRMTASVLLPKWSPCFHPLQSVLNTTARTTAV